jgi:hypothetical protein
MYVYICNRGGGLMEVTGESIIDGGNVSCIWGQTFNASNNQIYITATTVINESYVSCLTPKIPSQLINVTLILNGYVETTSYLTIQVIDEPVVTSITPARTVMGYNSTLFFEGNHMKNISSNPLCKFTHGDVVIGYSPLNFPSPFTGHCDVPLGVKPVKVRYNKNITMIKRMYHYDTRMTVTY